MVNPEICLTETLKSFTKNNFKKLQMVFETFKQSKDYKVVSNNSDTFPNCPPPRGWRWGTVNSFMYFLPDIVYVHTIICKCILYA